MATLTSCNCNAQYVLNATMMGKASLSGPQTSSTGPRTSMYSKTGVTFCPGECKHVSSSNIRGRFQSNFGTSWRRKLRKDFLLSRASVQKRLHSSQVQASLMDHIPSVQVAQQSLQHLNTDILVAIDNFRTSPGAQQALQSISDSETLIHLQESLTRASHQVEQLMANVSPSLEHINVSTSAAQQFVDQIGSWQVAVLNPAIDNIKTALGAQHISDNATLIHLQESLTRASHQVEQLMSNVSPSLEQIDVSTSAAQQFVDQIGSWQLADLNPAIDNIKTALGAQHISDNSSLIHLQESLTRASHQVEQLMSNVSPSLEQIDVSTSTAQQFVDQIGASMAFDYGNLGSDAMPLIMPALLATAVTSTIILSSAQTNKEGFSEGRDLPLRYDAGLIAAYFRKRPVDIVLRSTKIIFECSNLTFNVLWDKYIGREQEMERLRATQLVALIAKLGPTAIKIGQALSIRPDILPQVYLEELQKLQDRVPPFSNEEAKQIILESFGRPAEEVYAEMSEHPIAAASLGQVYKATLRETGVLVAVKVQRPGVLEGISRDLFLLRIGAWLFEKIPIVQSDMVGLLDTWAIRFFDELDYVQEARNGIQFSENMKSLPNVTVPEMFLDFTSRKVLTSAWVVGEKLSESDPAGLLPMITTAMNCYLVQLLESGFLHADPHPGNLLKTPDGRLCVLDFGLMTQVTEEQRYTLIEYISHLMNSDYARVADDLVRLGFVPEDSVNPEKTAAVVPQLTRVMSQLVQGGGVRKINVQQMTEDLTNMSKDYVFVIPPYFALILRAFSVLEGIGLDIDPDYSIVDACYPYLSKRLLTDDSPRTREALRYFLYGESTQLDINRVETLASGFQNFRDIMTSSRSDPVVPAPKVNYLDPTTKEALKLLFAPEGSFIQELILTEVVRAVDALSREALADLWQFFSQRLSLPAAMAIPGSWPLPMFVFGGMLGGRNMAQLSPDDYKSLDFVRRLWMLVEPHLLRPSTAAEFAELAQDVAPVVRDLLPGVRTVAQRFAIMLFQRQILRLADDLDGRHSVRDWDEDPAAFARRIQPQQSLPPSERKLQQLPG